MAKSRHELLKDACQTLGHLIEKHAPRYLEGAKVEVVYDPPDEEMLAKAAKKKGTVLFSLLLIDCARSTAIQSTNQPIVHEEDEEGNLVEYRCGPPTYMLIRFLVTPWVSAALEGQTALGAIMQHFNSYPEAAEEDIQGESIHAEDRVNFDLDSSFTLNEVMKLWEAFKRPYRPSLVYKVTLRMDSVKRTAIRRVREKVNLYRKLEG
jgi:hypothetical protein